MDKRTLKSIIVELKESDGNRSFQDIADILEKDYEIKMSRQAVCGMYNRATSDEAISKYKDLILATNDILNYHIIGLTDKTIKSIMANNEIELPLSVIDNIIKEHSVTIEQMTKDQVFKVISLINNEQDLEDIKESLSYKGETLTNKRLNNLIELSSLYMISESACKSLAKVMNLTENKTLIKKVINKLNLEISLKDIESELNK